MLDFDDLFVCATPTFESAEEEVRAVSEGRKALAWYPMTREQVEEYSDHDDVVALARAQGLAVLTWPRETASSLPAGAPVLDVFVLRPLESWRAHAFRSCREVLGYYPWSDSSEYLYSSYLGYSDESCKRWIAERRHNRLGWVGQTIYGLLEITERRALEALALRCFPLDFDTADRVVFAHPDGYLLREDLEVVLPADTFFCRFAVENAYFLRVFGGEDNEDRLVPSARLGVSARELNSQLLSGIEIWNKQGWQNRVVGTSPPTP